MTCGRTQRNQNENSESTKEEVTPEDNSEEGKSPAGYVGGSWRIQQLQDSQTSE